MAYFVYLLKCSDKSLYCGWTSDLEKRLGLHTKGKASKYTRARLPVKLVYFEKQKSRSLAMRREFRIKSFSRQEKLALVNSKKA